METQGQQQQPLEITEKMCKLGNHIAEIDGLVCDLTSRLAPLAAPLPRDTEKHAQPSCRVRIDPVSIREEKIRLSDLIQIHIEDLDEVKSKIVSILDRLEI